MVTSSVCPLFSLVRSPAPAITIGIGILWVHSIGVRHPWIASDASALTRFKPGVGSSLWLRASAMQGFVGSVTPFIIGFKPVQPPTRNIDE